MLRKIDELYRGTVSTGKKISEIRISSIGYDHLKSELSNRKEMPEWIDKIKIESNITGIKLIDEPPLNI